MRRTSSSLFDVQILAEDRHADRALFEVEDLAELSVGEFHLLSCHGVAQAIDPGNAVAHLQHPAHFGEIDLVSKILDLFGDHRRDFVYLELHRVTSDSIGTAQALTTR